MCSEQAACGNQGYHAVSGGQLPIVTIGSPRANKQKRTCGVIEECRW
jgi:hypothetical protein